MIYLLPGTDDLGRYMSGLSDLSDPSHVSLGTNRDPVLQHRGTKTHLLRVYRVGSE